MKKEQRVLTFSAIVNVIVFVLKIMGGILFSSVTIIVDGIYTITDFFTDLLAIVGAKVGRKRANKKHPFGYGRFEYIMQIFIGILISLVGIGLFIYSFFIKYQVPNLNIIYILILVILLKGLSSNYLFLMGQKISSVILISSAKESFIDVLSSIFILIIVLLGQFFSWMDIVGSLFISSLIILEGIKVIIDNVLLLIGEDDNNKEIKNKIKKIVDKFDGVDYSDSFLIRNGSYYQIEIEIGVSSKMSVKELLKIEQKIKRDIKKDKLKIKFISFDVRKG